jgi:hypothetical protein
VCVWESYQIQRAYEGAWKGGAKRGRLEEEALLLGVEGEVESWRKSPQVQGTAYGKTQMGKDNEDP